MALPAAYFAARGMINAPLGRRLSLLFLMGGTQGLVGWWMVRSGFQVSLPSGTGWGWDAVASWGQLGLGAGGDRSVGQGEAGSKGLAGNELSPGTC